MQSASSMQVPPSTSDTDQFKLAIKRFLQLHHMCREQSKQIKETRNEMNEAKAVIISFMQETALDVCNIAHGDTTGKLALMQSKRTKSLKKQDAIDQIQKYLQEHMQIDSADVCATNIWEEIQASRVSMLVPSLSVRSLG